MAERQITVMLPPDIPTPHLDQVVGLWAPGAIIDQWRELLRPHTSTGAALASLSPDKAIRYPYQGDHDAVAVVSTEPGVEYLDEGRIGFHLPSHWGNRGGQWVGTTAEGKRYAYVRFPLISGTHEGATSGVRRLGGHMPAEVYARARELADYGSGEQPRRLGGFGDEYKQAKSYDYYRELFGDAADELPEGRGYEWKASPYESLMRSMQVNPETGSKGSEYFTIRTIVEDSPGWWIPPIPAHHFSEQAMDRAMPAIEDLVDEAVAADMAAALAATTEGV